MFSTVDVDCPGVDSCHDMEINALEAQSVDYSCQNHTDSGTGITESSCLGLELLTLAPTSSPTLEPTTNPTDATSDPTNSPSAAPTSSPSVEPTNEPTFAPTVEPTNEPTNEPTHDPTRYPTFDPTVDPTTEPTTGPTAKPSIAPTNSPSAAPLDLIQMLESYHHAQHLEQYSKVPIIMILSVGALIVISSFLVMKWFTQKHDEMMVDDQKYGVVIGYILQVVDTIGSFTFTLQCGTYYFYTLPAGNGEFSHLIEENTQYNLQMIFRLSVVFLLASYGLNIASSLNVWCIYLPICPSLSMSGLLTGLNIM